MFPFRRILVPVDYSEPCRAVMPYARELARHFSAEVTLVHAYGAEALAYSERALIDPKLPQEVQFVEEERLRAFAGKAFPARHVESIAELGEAGAVIHRVVQHQSADLVMLGTHGRGPIRRLLLGSVTTKVLHDISGAVWTGNEAALRARSAEKHYKSILCAVNNDEETEGILRAAAAFAASYKARLYLLTVVTMPPPSGEIDFTLYKKEIMDAADVQLREWKGTLGIDAPHTVADASIAEGVHQEAVRRNADLIITGRGRAQGTFSRLWSHLFPIIREAPCPVLSI